MIFNKNTLIKPAFTSALLGVAALAGCNVVSHKAKTPPSAKLSQSGIVSYGHCIYKALATDPASGVSVIANINTDQAAGATISVEDKPVAIISVGADGKSHVTGPDGQSSDVSLDLKSPLSRKQLQAATDADCYGPAKLKR